MKRPSQRREAVVEAAKKRMGVFMMAGGLRCFCVVPVDEWQEKKLCISRREVVANWPRTNYKVLIWDHVLLYYTVSLRGSCIDTRSHTLRAGVAGVGPHPEVRNR